MRGGENGLWIDPHDELACMAGGVAMTAPQSAQTAFMLTPEYRDYVWGGDRLKPGSRPIAEAWVVYEQDRIASGPFRGRTLADVAVEYGFALLGTRAVQRTGARFPLLIKLLDCAQWLSLQVHPNDEQAVRLEGAGQFGKTEAWHFIEASPGAEILCSLRPGTPREQFEQAVRGGTLADLMQRLPVHAGDSLFISPGMIHALGPGLLLYEVQQSSDITYRVFDWNRPASEGRKLHIEQSLAVTDINAEAKIVPRPQLRDGDRQALATCSYFTLELAALERNLMLLDTQGESFHALTLIEGQAKIEGNGWQLTLGRFETAVIPAACGVYRIQPQGLARVLKASV
jgi:mannose-6-phosphate isomerase